MRPLKLEMLRFSNHSPGGGGVLRRRPSVPYRTNFSYSLHRICQNVKDNDESVCMRVHLFVCLQHNSKANDHKVFKLGIGNDLGYPRNGMFFLG